MPLSSCQKYLPSQTILGMKATEKAQLIASRFGGPSRSSLPSDWPLRHCGQLIRPDNGSCRSELLHIVNAAMAFAFGSGSAVPSSQYPPLGRSPGNPDSPTVHVSDESADEATNKGKPRILCLTENAYYSYTIPCMLTQAHGVRSPKVWRFGRGAAPSIYRL